MSSQIENEYKLTVRVWDSGSPPLYADTEVTVIIVEESRYPPTLFPLYSIVNSYKSAFSGGVIGKVVALDQDPYDTLVYNIGESLNMNNLMKYFDIDEKNGLLSAVTPLDPGMYSVNISVFDGKYEKSVEGTVEVRVITEEMVSNSIIIRIGAINPEDFISRYQKVFTNAIAKFIDIHEDDISILSIQTAILHKSARIDLDIETNRHKRETQKSIDVLLAAKDPEGGFFTRNKLKKLIYDRREEIQKELTLPVVSIMDSVCNSNSQCNGHGTCVDLVEIGDNPIHLNSMTVSLVASEFRQSAGCICDQGYDGETCDNLVNQCGHRPCAEYEICTPTDATPRGYTCHCPPGRAGPRCQVDLSKCQKPSCHYPVRPLSFKGKSYAQYSISQQDERNSLLLSLYIRTRHPVGVIVYASGEVDYSILEVSGGHVQYRWDCGSGEGLVRVSTVKVDDDKWHFINLTRDGTISTLTVDKEKSSGAAPGDTDILNMNSDFLFLGAKVTVDNGASSSYSRIGYGFVGCVDQMSIDGNDLPVSVTNSPLGGNAVLRRLANVELQCPEFLPLPGVCGSQPCLNGGTCSEDGDKFTCFCPPRFTGVQCQIDTAPCSSSPCLNEGKCIVIGHSYKCKCPPKLSGKRCEYGVYCNPNPCENGGRCEEGLIGAICKCQHYTGTRCQLDIDECTRNPCQNGGTCLNFSGGFKCLCAENATGQYCTELPDNLFKNTFEISLECILYIIAFFIAIVLITILLYFGYRRRMRHKRHQQNNRVKLTDHHVKNDLKANDMPLKRNSKICNVEADQVRWLKIIFLYMTIRLFDLYYFYGILTVL